MCVYGWRRATLPLAQPGRNRFPVAIDTARVMVLIFSESANISKHIAREIDIACDRKLTIIPVRVENVALGGSLRYFLGTSQWFDAFPGPLEAHLAKLVTTVRKSLGAPQATSAAARTPAKQQVVDAQMSRAAAPSRPKFFAGATKIAPPERKPLRLFAGIGALALIATVGAYLYSTRDEPAAPAAAIPMAAATPVETDCTKLIPPVQTRPMMRIPHFPAPGKLQDSPRR